MQGLTGFGYSLFSLPLLVLIMPAPSAVPMLSATSIFLNLLVFYRERRSLRLRWILPLLISGVAGLPMGIWLLKTMDQGTLKIIIGFLVVLSAAVYLSGFRMKLRHERWAMIPVGITSGVLNGATTFSGPPVILFFTNQGIGKSEFRAGLAFYFLILNLIAVPAFIAGDLLSGEVAVRTVKLFPAVVAGALSGVGLSERISQELFGRVALWVLALLGVFSVLSAL